MLPPAGPDREPSRLPSVSAPDPISFGHNRPHIIAHLFNLDAIGLRSREARERQRREAHASISYNTPIQPVTELPASVVSQVNTTKKSRRSRTVDTETVPASR
jgi:hypothetical protein